MAKKQTRRSISFSAEITKAIAEQSFADGKTASHWVSTLVRAELAARGKPIAEEPRHIGRGAALRAIQGRMRRAAPATARRTA